MSAIILFDGVCNLCNGAVQFVIRHDKTKYFRFSSLQSDAAQKLLESYGKDGRDLKSILLIENNQLYDQSTAILKISKHLNGVWRIGSVFLIVPKFIRDGIYRFIARNRYHWFGKREECMLPTKELQDRFL